MNKPSLISCCAGLVSLFGSASFAQKAPDCVIVCPRAATLQEQLAAKEVRRYVYVCTGQLLPIQQDDNLPSKVKRAIAIGTMQSPLFKNLDPALAGKISTLKPEAYLLRTVPNGGKSVVVIVGGDGPGVLYGAYRFAEHMGMAFEIDGDLIPDNRTSFTLPTLDESSAPLFKLRGIQPFHDFPEGPDWWNADDYLAIIAQLPKMGMNFIGLHTYPEGAPNAEPTVWIGREGEWARDGNVKRAYPASYQNSVRGNWGYRPKKTSDYSFGAAMLFDRDDYGSDIMRGLTPEPDTEPLSVEIFNRTGAMLRTAFTEAKDLGVKTCVGTETFLTVPKKLKERLTKEGKNPDDTATVKALYKGIFRRIADTYPVDYYWFWTPEGWTWEDVGEGRVRQTMTDLSVAIQAASEVHASFQLATCGWVLGPPSDRGLFDKTLPKDISISCINRDVGKTPVDPGFARIEGRSRWAIPWMEDDPSLLAPELWAGRTRKDAADALAYGCDGLLGIHWRTRILSPTFMALGRAGWNQSPWNKGSSPFAMRRGALNGTFVSVAESVSIANTTEPAIYRTVRRGVSGYYLAVPNGTYNVTFQFCDPVPPIRQLFDVLVQGKKVLDSLDVAARVGFGVALDTTCRNVAVSQGVLNIDFAERIGVASIAGIVIEGTGYSRRINCGGPAYKNYEADDPPTPRALPTVDLYQDWALHQFGPEVADAAAKIFSSIDSRLPEPATWLTGPGNVRPNERAWEEVQKEYAFVGSFESLRPLVQGKGHLERFDYWLNTFQHMKGMAKLGTLWGAYRREHDRVLHPTPSSSAETMANTDTLRTLGSSVLLPLRKQMLETIRELYGHLLATVTNSAELGTIANWEQHNFPILLDDPGAELEKLLGQPLSNDLKRLPHVYDGPPRIIVPTVRTMASGNEMLKLRVLLLAASLPTDASIKYRPMGASRYETGELVHISRGVYEAKIPVKDADIEYYVELKVDGKDLVYPATAPENPQTVVVGFE